MDASGQRLQNLALWLFRVLLQFYPAGFRSEFASEIQAVFVSRQAEEAYHGRAAWLAAVFREITHLVISILRERWHEVKNQKEKTMVSEDQLQKEAGVKEGSLATLQPAGAPGLLWFAGWTLLITAAIPVGYFAMAPLAVGLIWLVGLGVNAGFWSVVDSSILQVIGLFGSFALVFAAVQWFLLRRLLPRPGLWFVVTAAGALLAGLAGGFCMGRFSVQNLDLIWYMAALLLPFGLILGLAQWLHLRRFLPNAFWIIPIDILAAGSLLLVGRSITNLLELMIVLLPGAITGLGMMLLLRQPRPDLQLQASKTASRQKNRQFPRFARIGIGVAVLVPLFFFSIWAYAASQLTLAKNAGIYPTVEEAVIARASQGFGGAEVVRVENVWAAPNSSNTQPYLWFGGATVLMDQEPEGYNWTHYSFGSLYIHVKEGWVHIPEGAFPGFIGWVMELYNMEGVNG